MDRSVLQKSAAERLAAKKRFICQWATGTGKSGIVMEFLRSHPESTCLILVPETNNIENWTVEFSKFGVPMELVRVACYASFHKYENTDWDLLVFDEAPHVDTEKRKAICQSVKGKHILALGAVISDEERQTLESVYGKFDKSVVTLSQAIAWKILAEPVVYVLHMQIDNTNREHWGNGRVCTAREYYNSLQSKVANAVSAYNLKSTELNKRRMLQAGTARKRFLGKLKTRALYRITSYLKKNGRRFLCFCSSIEQANIIGKENAFTSLTPVSRKVLSKFNNHEIDSLFVVGKLIEGQNLNDIECGVIGQLGGTHRITVQELGRIMRSENPVVYIPVFDGTKDESFLYTLTASVPERCIKHYKL